MNRLRSQLQENRRILPEVLQHLRRADIFASLVEGSSQGHRPDGSRDEDRRQGRYRYAAIQRQDNSLQLVCDLVSLLRFQKVRRSS